MSKHIARFKQLSVEFQVDDKDDHLVNLEDLVYHDRHILYDTKRKMPLWASVLGTNSWRRVVPEFLNGDGTDFRRANMASPEHKNKYFFEYPSDIEHHPDAFPLNFLGQTWYVLLSPIHRRMLMDYEEANGGRFMLISGYPAHGFSQFTTETPATYLTVLLTELDRIENGLNYTLLNKKHRWDMRAPQNLTLSMSRRWPKGGSR